MGHMVLSPMVSKSKPMEPRNREGVSRWKLTQIISIRETAWAWATKSNLITSSCMITWGRSPRARTRRLKILAATWAWRIRAQTSFGTLRETSRVSQCLRVSLMSTEQLSKPSLFPTSQTGINSLVLALNTSKLTTRGQWGRWNKCPGTNRISARMDTWRMTRGSRCQVHWKALVQIRATESIS